jgi:type II secretory pathway component PulC
MVRANPLSAVQGVQIQPYMANGQMQGFAIGQVASDAPAAPYIQPGDHILAVDGTPITSATQAMGIYQQLRGASSVTVTIERGGQQQNVNYSLQ